MSTLPNKFEHRQNPLLFYRDRAYFIETGWFSVKVCIIDTHLDTAQFMFLKGKDLEDFVDAMIIAREIVRAKNDETT